MQRLILAMGLAVLIAAPTGALAAGSLMQPGLWEIASETGMAAHPRLHMKNVSRRCISKADVKKNDIMPREQPSSGLTCKPTAFSFSGRTATFTLACRGDGGQTTSTGKMNFLSRTAYNATVHTAGVIRGRSVNVTRTVHASRIGDCRNPN